MSDNLFPNKWNEIKRYPAKYEVGSHNTVRVYRYSPESVCLQIRGEKSYASAIVSFDLARQIAEALRTEAE